MKNFCSRFAVASLALLPVAAFAQATQFTDEASFLAAIGTGYYLENFSAPSVTGAFAPSLDFSGGSPVVFGYTVNAPTIPSGTPTDSNILGFLDKNGVNTISTEVDGFALQYTSTTGNIAGIGGYFEITDIDGNLQTGQLQFDLSDGTSLIVDVTTPDPIFLGFLNPDGTPLSTLSVFPIEGTGLETRVLYVANSELYVVPETSTYAAAGFMGLAVGGLWLRRSRKAA